MHEITFDIDNALHLKLLEQSDAPELFALIDANRDHLRQWLPWIDANASINESISFIQSAELQQKENLSFQCGIYHHNTLAGVIGFHRIDWINRIAEIGYWLGDEFQGNGIMTKSCLTLVNYAFLNFGLNRVQIRCASKNYRSQAVVKRLGFFEEGLLRQAEFLYDHYVDLIVYGITADIWKTLYQSRPKI
ncbi:MAG: GNAT family protein [Bacteroidota bacterium]